MSKDLMQVLEKVHGQPGDKPGKTTQEIVEESGLSHKKVQDLLKAGFESGKVEPVPWVNHNHWSGRPRQVICWRVK